ncbi:ferredoxin Fer [Halorarius halobius]|uniref:ferredoxin Fer n=1 Tax=Halorarius halobius TaxID=2962671 RepID=UPI0020CFC617|nr:ferredoxin Fer [Halorarius halobius]
MDSPFDVLGVDADADAETIERAYRQRVKDAHPDHGGSVGEFRRVRRAYEAAMAAEDAPDPVPESADDGVDIPEQEAEPETHVEYLDYDVLADHGWSLADDDLFEKAAAADLDPADHGRLLVEPSESLLEAAENRGFDWPFACRGGACSNCAVAVYEGEMPMPKSHILPQELLEKGVRLSCISAPTSEEAKVVFNVKHLPALEELLLPAGRFN